jgi:hypothetical protein
VVDDLATNVTAGTSICLPQPDDIVSSNGTKVYTYKCTAGCADLSCFCRDWLLPAGWYVSPFDTAGMTVFQCDPLQQQATRAIRVCSESGYRPNLSTLRCELGAPKVCDSVKKGLGFCDVSAIRSVRWDKVERPPNEFCDKFNIACDPATGQGGTGRRLMLGTWDMDVPAARTALGGSYRLLTSMLHSADLAAGALFHLHSHHGRQLLSAWDDSTSVEVRDLKEPSQCNSYDVQLASQFGCWKPYVPFGNSWPAASKTVAKAYSLTQQNSPNEDDGRVCTCTFQHACPVAVSENCLGLARLRGRQGEQAVA